MNQIILQKDERRVIPILLNSVAKKSSDSNYRIEVILAEEGAGE